MSNHTSTKTASALLMFKLAKKYKLSDQQFKMATDFMAHGNKTKAYTDNYGHHDSKSKRKSAFNMFLSKNVQNFIKESMDKTLAINNIITVDEIVERLARILEKEDARDQDVIKASEVLLKHLNAFNDHNSSKATKVLLTTTTLKNLTEEQLAEELKKLTVTTLEARNNKSEYVDFEEADEQADQPDKE